ncbi:nucleolin 1-like [Camellia sinensis]|uniref:nucleolin 1-like n=1 Tax=Camellia sinensis TaxID=4442 RepID=UPI0010356545|nr:nucleolin 1-like [Camellia sinensis]
MVRPKPIAKDLLASIPSDVDAQSTQTLPPPKPKRIKKAQPKAKVTQVKSKDALPISNLAESDKSQPSAGKRRSEAQPSESPKSKKPRSSSATTSGSKNPKLVDMKREFSYLQKTNKNLQSKMKKLENQVEAAIKAQTEAEEKAESSEAIRKVAESQRKEAEEKMLNVPEDSPLRKADAIPLPFPLSPPLSQDVGESKSEDGDEDEDKDKDEALVRKSKDTDGAQSPLQKEQVLDLTQDEEGNEVPKDAAYEKVSADVPFVDKSIEETLQGIDAELMAEKVAEVASQQSSEVPAQLTVDAEEP